jgi:hypothetical protein
LIVNRPWQGTGNRFEWSFSGAEDVALRECLMRLDEFVASDLEDRWIAAIVFGFSDRSGQRDPQGAWTIEGALALAAMLPESLGDVCADLVSSFSARIAGWPGDAHTPPARQA